MRGTAAALVFCLLARAFSAPIDISVDKKAGPRVSTKEILTLEQQLKAQAGEDKKFYPSETKHKENVPPPQQVDGLEDDTPPAEPRRQEEPGQPGAPEPGPGQGDAAAEQLLDLTGEGGLGQDAPGTLDLAQRDELEAAEKRRHQEAPSETRADAPDALQDAGFYGEPEAEAELAGKAAARDAGRYAEGDAAADAGGDDDGEEEEALFMQSVIDALRDRPQLLQQFLQGRLDDDLRVETRVPAPEDDADRAAVIRAEVLAATGAARGRPWDGQAGAARGRPWDGQAGAYIPAEALITRDQPVQVEDFRSLGRDGDRDPSADETRRADTYLEQYQRYQGDQGARVVKKAFHAQRQSADSGEDKSGESSQESSQASSQASSQSSQESLESLEDTVGHEFQ